jgi:putative redox protein
MTVNADDTVTVTNKHGTELLVDIDGERGLSPLELLLAALGACSAVDFAILMRKQRDPVEPLHLEVDGDKEDYRMDWLRVTYHVHEGADEGKVERARSRVANDVCTVSRTIAGGTPVEHVIA